MDIRYILTGFNGSSLFMEGGDIVGSGLRPICMEGDFSIAHAQYGVEQMELMIAEVLNPHHEFHYLGIYWALTR